MMRNRRSLNPDYTCIGPARPGLVVAWKPKGERACRKCPAVFVPRAPNHQDCDKCSERIKRTGRTTL